MQLVLIQGTISNEDELECSVLQYSAPGPYMFGYGFRDHPIYMQFHLHADDTQIYLAFKPRKDKAVSLTILEK